MSDQSASPRRDPRGRWLVRYLEDAPRERSACGYRHRLLSRGDDTAAFAHLVRIFEATPHYHERTTEIYYVVEGSGAMSLDGEEIALRPGACIEIKPGVVHGARGDVLVLVIGIPSISDDDTFPAPGRAAACRPATGDRGNGE